MRPSSVFKAFAASFALLALTDISSAGAFTPGNLVVVRVGDGSAALTSAATVVFVDEYTPSGTLVQTLALPTTTSGSQLRFTNSGSATSEGFLTLSSDGLYLVHGGYDAAPGTTSVAGTTSAANPRVVARWDLSGNLDTSTGLTDAHSAGNIRSVVSDGTQFWTAGSNAGVRYATGLGATTTTQLNTTPTNCRVLGIFGGQLYISNASGAFQGISTVGTGLPTTAGQTVTILPGFPTATGPSSYDYFFADASTLYVADDRTNGSGGIQKWTLSAGTWSLQYTLAPAASVGCRGLTGVVNAGVATLYATTTASSANTLVTVTDTGVGSTFTTVATTGANTALRGVRLIPSNCTADSDGDGTPDCLDGCPNDPAKTAPGICGCGVSDADTDGDGTADCLDGCPADPNKTSAGICGCGVSDADTDGDGTVDCLDGCPADPAKTAPGVCGCGVSDVDTDGDGTEDCNDGCPADPAKTAPGVCGCGVSDTDTDGDGTADCIDGCPADPNKIAAGQCGCGNPDTDTDSDGVADCLDNCDSIANPGQEDCDLDGVGDACEIGFGSFDVNGNLVPDECESNGTQYCFADGTSFNCPCGNNATAPNEGCKNSSNRGATLYNSGGISAGGDDAVLTVIHLPVNKAGIIFMANNQVSVPFGDGRLCTSGGTKRFQVKGSGSTGSFTQTGIVALSGGTIIPGATKNFQAWYRDPVGPCGGTFNLSSAVQITFTP